MNCPWRTDLVPYLEADRVVEIVQAPGFQCHKTLDFSSEEKRKGDNPQQCAGLMLMLHRSGYPNQIMQVGQRLGEFSPEALDPESPVYTSIRDAVVAHGGDPAVLLPRWMQRVK